MPAAHLIFEEAGEQQALCGGGLQRLAITRLCRVENEVIEDGREIGRRRQLRIGVCRDLRVMREHAGVVEQFLAIDGRVGDFQQAGVEELERLTVIDGEQFP
jgi:hypothetical protein